MSLFNTAMMRKLAFGVVAAALAPVAMAADTSITGAGASFPYPIYSKWAATYKEKSGVGLNYQSIGSSGGVKQIKSKTVTFGASDKPLKIEELNEGGLTQFPAVMGGVVPIVNVKGVKSGDLTMDGALLSDIFLGKITKWDDKRIKSLNPSATLPSTRITVVHRADGSGTTFLFTDYLAKVNGEWRESVGAGNTVEWPTGIGAKGNEGVAGIASQTDGAIGYVEFAYAKQNKLAFTKMVNKNGVAVSPSNEAFSAADDGADWAGTPGFAVVLTDQAGAAAWPITGASFVIVYKKPSDPAALREVLKFYDWSFGDAGAKIADELDYVPLPKKLTDLIRASWKANISDAAGRPLL